MVVRDLGRGVVGGGDGCKVVGGGDGGGVCLVGGGEGPTVVTTFRVVVGVRGVGPGVVSDRAQVFD